LSDATRHGPVAGFLLSGTSNRKKGGSYGSGL
jgi:hypothetical protein